MEIQEALLCRPVGKGRTQCLVCLRRCEIDPGETGFCSTRRNHNGKLRSLVYGRVSSLRVSPIEIKPIYHFYPQSRWLSLGSVGCNFRCPGCQNWEIAHARAEAVLPTIAYVSPEKAVQKAIKEGCQGISWTYNEPTVWFEYTLETARLAKNRGLFINYVTNGAMTLKAMDLLGPFLDAFRVDLKGFCRDTYKRIAGITDFKGILKNIVRAKTRWASHVEIITNVIPGVNDDKEELKQMACWIVTHLGPETPWHLTRFAPHHQLDHLEPTPIAQLEELRAIGKDQGVQFVYLGNVPGHEAGNTFCPKCGNLVIARFHCKVIQYHLQGNRCPACGHEIAGFFNLSTPDPSQL